VLAIREARNQTLLVWTFLDVFWAVLVAQDLTDMLNVVVVLEALLAALLADIFVATSALRRVSSGLKLQILCVNGLCELGIILRLRIIDHVKIIHGGV
jgi:hypothetical protein